MSFRKRNAVISAAPSAAAAGAKTERQLGPGLRPSPLDGCLTTSTGTSSLDGLLAGHAGLPLGTSLLVEEQGTTDFSGVLLRYYAAEGLVQGHQVHVLGFSEAWQYELPALSTPREPKAEKTPGVQEEKMKIAWRYEALNRSLPSRDRSISADRDGASSSVFCHTFDLTKRLASTSIKGVLSASPASAPPNLSFVNSSTPSPLKLFIKNLQTRLSSSDPSSVHRVVVPSLLSPNLYDSRMCEPSEVLQFLHSLRALLRQFSGQLTALVTLPTSLFPRGSGLTTWMELLADGVLELVPLPPDPSAGFTSKSVKPGSKDADVSQGLLRVYSLPVYHEKGGGGAEGNHFRENLSFSLSTSKGLVIKPYSLPPLEDDEHHEKSPASTVKDGIEF